MVLAKGEEILKSWDYSTSGMVDVTTSTLTVTNKRIVSTVKNSRRLSQQEVALKDAKSVFFAHGAHRKWLSWLFIFLGLGAILISFFSACSTSITAHDEYSYRNAEAKIAEAWFAFLYCLIVGTPFILIGVIRMLSGLFSVVITVEGKEATPFACGASGIFGKRMRHKGGLIVKVNHEVAEEIIECLGAIIIDNK